MPSHVPASHSTYITQTPPSSESKDSPRMILHLFLHVSRCGCHVSLLRTIFDAFRGRQVRYKNRPSIRRNRRGTGEAAPDQRVRRNDEIAHENRRDARIPTRLVWAERCAKGHGMGLFWKRVGTRVSLLSLKMLKTVTSENVIG